MSVNYRKVSRTLSERGLGLVGNMTRGLGASWPVSFLVREVLETETEYSDAVRALKDSDLMASTYIIVAGAKAGEGEVITRSPSPTVNPLYIHIVFLFVFLLVNIQLTNKNILMHAYSYSNRCSFSFLFTPTSLKKSL